jgi:hypothetical protein
VTADVSSERPELIDALLRVVLTPVGVFEGAA